MPREPKLNWRARETHEVSPHQTSPHALDAVAFRRAPHEKATTGTVPPLGEVSDWQKVHPELVLDVDQELLTKETEVDSKDIELSVVMRDRELNKFKLIAKWPLVETENLLSLESHLEEFSYSKRMDVCVLATLANELRISAPAIGTPKGSVLAEKTFQIRIAPKNKPPTKMVDPDDLEKQGLDRTTVCYVHWRSTDLQTPINDAIEIWLNKEYEDKFMALAAARGASNSPFIAQAIGAQIYCEIFDFVLQSEEENISDPNSVMAIVSSMLEKQLDMTLDEAKRIRKKEDGLSHLKSWMWKVVGANDAFSALRF